jgi:hypothetical protein
VPAGTSWPVIVLSGDGRVSMTSSTACIIAAPAAPGNMPVVEVTAAASTGHWSLLVLVGCTSLVRRRSSGSCCCSWLQ